MNTCRLSSLRTLLPSVCVSLLLSSSVLAFSSVSLLAAGCTKKSEETPTTESTEAATTEAKPEAADATDAETSDEASLPAPADVAAAPADAVATESGLKSKVLQPGTGTEHPKEADRVLVHYTGWTTDGKMFDSSVTRGEPAAFPLNRVIPGWTEGVQLMVKGEKRRFWIPGNLAYGELAEGEKNAEFGPPKGTLVFDVELLDILQPPPVPTDVKRAPKNAEKTKSGLASKVLEKGTGTEHPKATDRVRVHYTGWTTEGEMFDSSVMRARPIVFPLDRVIPGWTEGVQLMVEGEKRRFWIPGKLAYGELEKGEKPHPGSPPKGTLVFDVELLEILHLDDAKIPAPAAGAGADAANAGAEKAQPKK